MEMIRDSFVRLLQRGAGNPRGLWSDIEESGFLDLLGDGREELGASLSDVHEIAFMLGQHGIELPVAETIIGRATLGPAAPTGQVLLGDGSGWPDEITADAAIVVAPQLSAGPLRMRALAAACMASRMCGAMQTIMTLTIEYAQVRKQFGKPIAGFQVVQQQIALMAEEATAASMAASRCLTGDLAQFSDTWAAVAKSRCCRAGEVVGAVGHAVHGAIGVSEEHSLGHHVRRLRRWSAAHGGQAFWDARLGESLLASSGSFQSFLLLHA